MIPLNNSLSKLPIKTSFSGGQAILKIIREVFNSVEELFLKITELFYFAEKVYLIIF